MTGELEEITVTLDNILNNVEHTEEFLLKLQDSLEFALGTLSSLKDESALMLDSKGRLQTSYINTYVFNYCINTVDASVMDTLIEEIAKAAQTSLEYNEDILLGPLLRAAQEPGNVKYTENRSGWTSNIEVTVNMDGSAGNLEQWAQAVKTVREQLGSKQKSALRASNYWKYRVFGRSWQGGSYEQTIQMRFQAAGALAPYWSLLDNGNYSFEGGGMSSDWGGTPYPTNNATHFTDKVAQRLQSLFKAELMSQQEYLNSRVEEIKVGINKLQDYITRLQELIDSFSGWGGEVIDLELTQSVERVISKYEALGRQVDPLKVSAAITSILSGTNLKYRYEIGARGGQRTRPTFGSLFGAIYGE